MNNPVDQPKVSELDATQKRIWDVIEERIDAAPVDGIAADGQWNVHVKWQQRGYVDGLRSARLAAINAVAALPQPQATTVGVPQSEAPYWVPKNLRKTVGGQPVGLTPLHCESKGASDYCMHCGRDIIDTAACDALERLRLQMIPDEEVTAFGCAFEAGDIAGKVAGYHSEEITHCEKWCHRPTCPFSLRSSEALTP